MSRLDGGEIASFCCWLGCGGAAGAAKCRVKTRLELQSYFDVYKTIFLNKTS
jgi:hypothetical protein